MNECCECKRSEMHVVLLETPFYARFQTDYIGFETGKENKSICFTCFITIHFNDYVVKYGLKY